MSKQPVNTRLVHPKGDGELDEVRKLIREFVRWHRARHYTDVALIDAYFDPVAFEAELAGLPGKYQPPDGDLLLAYYREEPAGCVALRRLDPSTCEMKRMFVYSHLHGKGIGLHLAETIIHIAREKGYRRMLLDTSMRQVEAVALYDKLGFQRVKPYYEMPDELRSWLVFFELAL